MAVYSTPDASRRSKVKETVIRDLIFAADCALCASSEQFMQSALDSFKKACDSIDLTISTKKIEVLFKPAPGREYQDPNILVNG